MYRVCMVLSTFGCGCVFFFRRLDRALEFGLLEYLRRKWFPEKPGCQGDQKTVRPVSLELVQTAFVMAAAGLALAAMLLALECLMDSHRPRQTD